MWQTTARLLPYTNVVACVARIYAFFTCGQYFYHFIILFLRCSTQVRSKTVTAYVKKMFWLHSSHVQSFRQSNIRPNSQLTNEACSNKTNDACNSATGCTSANIKTYICIYNKIQQQQQQQLQRPCKSTTIISVACCTRCMCAFCGQLATVHLLVVTPQVAWQACSCIITQLF